MNCDIDETEMTMIQVFFRVFTRIGSTTMQGNESAGSHR